MMKSIKKLAALAIPVMFAACTNEEIVVDAPQNFNEVVGAELIGTDISMNVSMNDGINSRVNGAGEFTTDDLLALGWIVKTGAMTPQDKTQLADNDNLYANHLFSWSKDLSRFTTYGNVYKGWHFAYYPYEYMDAIGEKTIVINPAQKSKEWADRLSQIFRVSAQEFLTSANLENNALNSEFTLYPTANVILLNTKASEGTAFAEGGSLADLNIKSVTFVTSQGVFAKKAVLKATNLPEKSELTTDDELKEYLYRDIKPVMDVTEEFSKKVVTDVKDAGYKVSEDAHLMTLAVPETANLEATETSIQVEVGSGKFNINYDATAEEGSDAAYNNDAIKALVAAYKKGGSMTSLTNETTVLNVKLYSDIFEADFSQISDLDEWNDAVTLAAALNRTEQEFGIDGDIEFNEGQIPMPEGCNVTLKQTTNKAALTIAKGTELASWPENLTNTKVNVVVAGTVKDATGMTGKTITINKGGKLNLPANGELASKIVNKGIISLRAGALLSNVDNDNTEGRIAVTYGAKVNVGSGKDGVIAYAIEENEKAYKINNLIDGDYGVKVNTLVVGSGKTLNLNLTDGGTAGSDDPYNPVLGAAGVELGSLSTINIELKGGNIIVGEGSNKNVAEIAVASGENTITDAIPTSVSVAENAKLTIATTAENGMLDWANTDVINNGEMIVTAKLHVKSINNSGTITATGYYVHSSTEPVLNDEGTVKGIVVKCDQYSLELSVYNKVETWKATKTKDTDKTMSKLIADIKLTDGNKEAKAVYTEMSKWFKNYGGDLSVSEQASFTKKDITTYNEAIKHTELQLK